MKTFNGYQGEPFLKLDRNLTASFLNYVYRLLEKTVINKVYSKQGMKIFFDYRGTYPNIWGLLLPYYMLHFFFSLFFQRMQPRFSFFVVTG